MLAKSTLVLKSSLTVVIDKCNFVVTHKPIGVSVIIETVAYIESHTSCNHVSNTTSERAETTTHFMTLLTISVSHSSVTVSEDGRTHISLDSAAWATHDGG
jgi:hypothetical protein